MPIYTILQITEPDYGCEESHRAEPTALLKLCPDTSTDGDENADIRYVEVAERMMDAGKEG